MSQEVVSEKEALEALHLPVFQGPAEPDPGDIDSLYMAQAHKFLTECGLDPNHDAVDQLARAFLPALRIMCERDHDPGGQTWKESGWKPLLHEIMKKTGRLRYRSWLYSRKDYDSPTDLINYLGMLHRAWQDDLSEWGDWGKPG